MPHRTRDGHSAQHHQHQSTTVNRAQITFNFIFYGILTIAFLYAVGAFAQAIAPAIPPSQDPQVILPPPGLEWLAAFLQWLANTFPKIGPLLVEGSKYVGAAAALFTALSLAVSTILRIPALVARWSGATETADKIEALLARIKPWLDYFSIFNAKSPNRSRF